MEHLAIESRAVRTASRYDRAHIYARLGYSAAKIAEICTLTKAEAEYIKRHS